MKEIYSVLLIASVYSLIIAMVFYFFFVKSITKKETSRRIEIAGYILLLTGLLFQGFIVNGTNDFFNQTEYETNSKLDHIFQYMTSDNLDAVEKGNRIEDYNTDTNYSEDLKSQIRAIKTIMFFIYSLSTVLIAIGRLTDLNSSEGDNLNRQNKNKKDKPKKRSKKK